MKNIHLQLIIRSIIMKKYILIFITMVLTLTSCGGKEKMGFNTRDKMNMQMADKIVDCINNGDVDGLYNLFSEEVRVNDKSLKADIAKIYHYLHGKIESYEKWAIGNNTSIEKEKNSTAYRSKFIIKINNASYFLYYDNTVRNDFYPEKVGLLFVKIFAETDKDKYFCYWNEIEPGIFLPDEAK